MGPYCEFCQNRCFVQRVMPPASRWRAGEPVILATCFQGMAHDRRTTGYDASTSSPARATTRNDAQ